jgi:exonuclease SbcC
LYLERQRAFGYDERNFHLQRFDLASKVGMLQSTQNSIDQLKVHQDLKRFKETILALEMEVAVEEVELEKKENRVGWQKQNSGQPNYTKVNFEDLKKKTCFDFN